MNDELEVMIRDFTAIKDDLMVEYMRVSDLLDDIGYDDVFLVSRYNSLAVRIADICIQLEIWENELSNPRNPA